MNSENDHSFSIEKETTHFMMYHTCVCMAGSFHHMHDSRPTLLILREVTFVVTKELTITYNYK